MRKDSTLRTLLVALVVCVVCSVVVSTMAIVLKPIQQANKVLEVRTNILLAAGIIQRSDRLSRDEVNELFEKNIETRVINVDTGDYVPADQIDPATFDERKAAKDPTMSEAIPDKADLAKIRRRAIDGTVYIKRDANKRIERLILPIYGKGLWSTMYGFLALDADGCTVKNLSFYEHGETPGLGGEIEKAWWQDKWVGKVVIDANGKPQMEIVKIEVTPDTPGAQYKVDSISGATLTSRGVQNTVLFWLGDDGYGPYLKKLRKSGQLRKGGQS